VLFSTEGMGATAGGGCFAREQEYAGSYCWERAGDFPFCLGGRAKGTDSYLGACGFYFFFSERGIFPVVVLHVYSVTDSEVQI